MSMDRLPISSTRTTTIDQADQRTDNLTDEREQEGEAMRPAMRQRQTGREDLEDEKNEDQPRDVSLLNQHSKPELSSRSNANQMSFQLEPIDQEKFFYTKKQFFDALEKQDIKAVVRMLRHGQNVDANNLTNGDTWHIVDTCIKNNHSELLSELIRESREFDDVAEVGLTHNNPADRLEKIIAFVTAMDNRRALPKDLKKNLFSKWLLSAIQSGVPDKVEAVMRLESSFLAEVTERDRVYCDALECALRNKNDLHELLLKNMFIDQSQVKIGISAETCSYAAGLAVATSHPDWAILLQDARLNMERMGGIDDPDFQYSLGHKLNTDEKKHFIEDLFNIKRKNTISGKFKFTKLIALHKKNSNSDPNESDIYYDFLHLLIRECIRPEVAEAIAAVMSKSTMVVLDESSNSSEDSDEDGKRMDVENPRYLMMQAFIATQLDSLVIENDLGDVTTALQVSVLPEAGKYFFDDLLSDIPKLIDDCFDLMDFKQTLYWHDVQKFLIDNFAFPESLAHFLAVSMSKLVTDWENKPGMVLPRPMSFLEISKFARQSVKESACSEFKNTFSELIKSRELLSQFNDESVGREDIWPNYFYAYLDRLKAALPPAKTAQ